MPVYHGEGARSPFTYAIACAIAIAPTALLAQQDQGSLVDAESAPVDPQTSPAPSPDGLNPETPIISDEEFEEVVPELDPAMNGPLESMEEFQARQDALDAEAEQRAEAAEKGSAESLPAAQDGDSEESLADAPITDPAIEQPLQALSEFEVQPVTIEDDTSDDQDVEIKYGYRIDGLGPVEEMVEDVNVSDQFADLSALEDGDGTAANAAPGPGPADQRSGPDVPHS